MAAGQSGWDISLTPANRVMEVLYDQLGDTGGCLYTDYICEAAGISADKLPATVAELCRRGHVVQVHPGRGVSLDPPLMLDANLIERGLDVRRIGQSVICFATVSSTNDIAMDSAMQGDTDGLVVTAETQNAGRGRQGRKWHAAPGSGLLMSAVLLDKPGAISPGALTVAAGLAVAEGIDAESSAFCGLKWPNDVYIGSAKIAGILLESRNIGNMQATVVGIGVNVHSSPPACATDRPSTHLAEHTPQADRIALARSIIERLDFWTEQVCAGRLEGLHDGWASRCSMINERVRVRSDGEVHVGRVVDISPLEGLILSHDDGTCVCLPAATSSILLD